MKEILLILIIGFSVPIQAQNIIDTKTNRVNKEQKLMNFIKSDANLYEHYLSGKSNLSAAKNAGYTSLGFFGGGVMLVGIGSAKSDGLGQIVVGILSIITGSLISLAGFVYHTKGKGKIREVMDIANREMKGDYSENLKFQNTSNGVGFVYSF